jgi:hypothetical protein
VLTARAFDLISDLGEWTGRGERERRCAGAVLTFGLDGRRCSSRGVMRRPEDGTTEPPRVVSRLGVGGAVESTTPQISSTMLSAMSLPSSWEAAARSC